jgi:uncharacterized protein (DUF924 family)
LSERQPPVTQDDVLEFWFDGDPAARREVWFRQSDAFDAACARFRPALQASREGQLDHWAETPSGALALILLLDQFPRNLNRGSPLAFTADAKAREIARRAIARSFDAALTPVQRAFMYLPFEHSEHMADQEESVRLYTALHAELGGEALDYAQRHRDVIRRFGRFPHRNAALGRTSTREEKEYLSQPGAGF